MSTLTLQTPYTLGPCGCLLETGDRDQPLFVPCRTHTATEVATPATSRVTRPRAGAQLQIAGGCRAHGGSRVMRVYRSDSDKVGGCNFCSRWITSQGGVRHKVTVMESTGLGGGLQARACDPCLAELRKFRP